MHQTKQKGAPKVSLSFYVMVAGREKGEAVHSQAKSAIDGLHIAFILTQKSSSFVWILVNCIKKNLDLHPSRVACMTAVTLIELPLSE